MTHSRPAGAAEQGIRKKQVRAAELGEVVIRVQEGDGAADYRSQTERNERAAAGQRHGWIEERKDLDGLEAAHDFRDVVFLKQADGSDTGGSDVETGGAIFKRDASQGEHRNFVTAGAAKGVEASWRDARSIFFLEDRREQDEIRPGCRCALDLEGLVAGGADRWAERSVRAT
jgi:hypothetical protein